MRSSRALEGKLDGLSPAEAACFWRVRLADPEASAEEVERFARWRAESPEHQTAYEAMSEAWQVAGESATDRGVLALREEALNYQFSGRARRWQWVAAAAAAAVAFIVFVRSSDVPATWLAKEAPGDFSTAVGQRSTLRLPDGSVVTLNTASRLETEFTPGERAVRLLAGEAIFEVSKDSSRPFVVFAADRRITALGTAFDVRVDARELKVTLVEGLVAVDQVSGASALPARMHLAPGEQLVAAVGGSASVRSADAERVISWREGRLSFKADPLRDAVAEMNRYTESPIVFADPAIGDLRISGVFRTGQPEAFANALSQYFPLRAAPQGEAIVLIWSR